MVRFFVNFEIEWTLSNAFDIKSGNCQISEDDTLLEEDIKTQVHLTQYKNKTQNLVVMSNFKHSVLMLFSVYGMTTKV